MIGSVLVCIVYVIAAFAPTIEVLVFTYGLLLGKSDNNNYYYNNNNFIWRE